jgi:hypothetical protein
MVEYEWNINSSLEELKRGYTEEEDRYVCVCCGHPVEKGIIYPEDGVLYEASRYIKVHLEKEHGSVFEFLLSLDKSVTGLSEVQKKLLALFYQGRNDTEVQKELGIGSTSTIRNHRFALREKERQARTFLAVMELLRDMSLKPQSAGKGTGTAGTKARTGSGAAAGTEKQQVLAKYFPQGTGGALRSFSMKEKHKRIVLNELANRFEYGRHYTEQEVNDILEPVFGDYALLRRYLVDYRYMEREPDGSRYWLPDNNRVEGAEPMSRKEELKQLAKEVKIEGGVFQVKNNRNGKIYLESTRNFKTMNGHEFSLKMGSHMVKELQQDWNEYGEDAFTFEVLERLKKKDTGFFDEKDELRKLKEKWLRELQPYGERGYNSSNL